MEFVIVIIIAVVVINFLVQIFIEASRDSIHEEVMDNIKKENKASLEAVMMKLQAIDIERALKKSQQNDSVQNEPAQINKEVNIAEANENKPKDDKQFEGKKAQEEPTIPTEVDPLKAKGDKYERYIGARFEEKGDLVIYNGFIQGYKDGGVDIVSISSDARTMNLVQCKHWSIRALELEHIESIYEKLNTHNMDFLRLSTNQINEYLSAQKLDNEIDELLSIARKNKKTIQIRKTLYISSDKVVNLEIGKHLTMIQPNIFRYRDMKIVVEQYS